MNTPPYNQPAPFPPEMPPVPVQASKPSSGRLLLPVVGVLVVAAVAFAGGFAVATATSSQSTANTGGGQGGQGGQGFGGNFGPGASGRPRGGFGGNTTGTVGSVSAGQMTITTGAGGSKIVLLTPTTRVTEVTSATKSVSDINTGNNVTVVGTANPDGSVTATSVVVGDLGVFGRGPRGDNGSPAPSTVP